MSALMFFSPETIFRKVLAIVNGLNKRGEQINEIDNTGMQICDGAA